MMKMRTKFNYIDLYQNNKNIIEKKNRIPIKIKYFNYQMNYNNQKH